MSENGYLIPDNDTLLPNHYDIDVAKSLPVARVAELAALVQTLSALDRLVIVRYVSDEQRLYFSSHPDTITLPTGAAHE